MDTLRQNISHSVLLIVGIALLFLALSVVSQPTASAECFDLAPPCYGNPPAELVFVFCRADDFCGACSNPEGCCREAEYICGDGTSDIWRRCHLAPCM